MFSGPAEHPADDCGSVTNYDCPTSIRTYFSSVAPLLLSRLAIEPLWEPGLKNSWSSRTRSAKKLLSFPSVIFLAICWGLPVALACSTAMCLADSG